MDFLPKIKQFLAKKLKKVPTGKITPLNNKQIVEFQEFLKKTPKTPLNITISPDDLALIQYTGGTTGLPKGAMITHRNLVADILIVQRWLDWTHYRGQRVALSGFPFFHIAGLFFCINCIFLGWAQPLIPNPRDTDFICAKIKKYHPNYYVNVPSLFQILLNNPKFTELDHSQVYACITAASPFPKESQERLETIVGKGVLIECYGMTETSPLSAMNPSKGKKKLGTVGLPLLNNDIKLLDPTSGTEVEIGKPGEICVKGPNVMQGYYNKPEETAHAIDKGGYMHTGDVGIFDEEGYLRIVDRTKDMIIVGGFKVFSKATEDTLAKHPDVDMVAIIGYPNPERPGSEFVKAVIALKPGVLNEKKLEDVKADILKYAKDHCAPYEVPKILDIRESKDIPFTSIGKINKLLLRKEARQEFEKIIKI